MKPIEPGCKCVIVADKYTPENVGKVVTVIHRYGQGSFFIFKYPDGITAGGSIDSPAWSVVEQIDMRLIPHGSSPLVVRRIVDLCGSNGKINGLVGEHRLMRIDGGDFDDNPYREKKPVSEVLDSLQAHWINSPEVWDEHQRRAQHG
ncbi:hypothetical protein [Klebsiella quasipneumoniae]|uniref:hypothetical protein n=1 Tax=Klebsiella quasipneumoniae TaxID=1463165 RepID=UPI0023B07D85|nr:hypothetical protein [Klebsiella quasipneumoniae]